MTRSHFFKWVLLLVCLFLIFALPKSVVNRGRAYLCEAAYPLQSCLSVISSRSKEALDVLRGIGGTVKHNREMATELVWLRNKVRDLRAVESENAALRAQLNFIQQDRRELIAAEVVGRDISGWWQTIRLGSGLAQGVRTNSAVITPDGLVGRVVSVSSQTADVLLISDPGCRVAVRLPRTGAFGVLSGRGVAWNGRAFCRVNFLNKDLPVRVGDEVVTSGLGGVFPKGLLIGYVEKIFMDRSGLYQYADVLPKTDLGQLSYVFVVYQEVDSVVELLRQKGEFL